MRWRVGRNPAARTFALVDSPNAFTGFLRVADKTDTFGPGLAPSAQDHHVAAMQSNSDWLECF
jgi:hypothetical protein